MRCRRVRSGRAIRRPRLEPPYPPVAVPRSGKPCPPPVIGFYAPSQAQPQFAGLRFDGFRRAAVINADWRKSLDGIFMTGRNLEAAKDELSDDDYSAMLRDDLDFSAGTANRLMQLVNNIDLKAPAPSELPTRKNWGSLIGAERGQLKPVTDGGQVSLWYRLSKLGSHGNQGPAENTRQPVGARCQAARKIPHHTYQNPQKTTVQKREMRKIPHLLQPRAGERLSSGGKLGYCPN